MSGPFERQLRAELMAAATRERPSRRRRGVAAIVAGAIGTAAVAFLTLAGPGPARADVEITVDGDRVAVRIMDLMTTPDEVRRAFVEAGLDARIDSSPAGPSNVGRFVGVVIDGKGSPTVRYDGERDAMGFKGFSVPADWEGTLVISLGVPAEPGEPYRVASNAFAAGEPLHCVSLVGGTLAEALDDLGGLRVRVLAWRDGMIVPPVELADVDLSLYGSWRIRSGEAFSPTDVLLQLVDEPVEPTAEEAEC